MPQFLALQWNPDELRVAVASRRGGRVTVEQAFSIAAPAVLGEDRAPAELGRQVAEALSARGIGHADALVAVGRTNLELRELSFPPAPDDELPDMVRIQAAHEFNELGDDWPLDFVPIDDGPGGPRTVLAAAASPHLVGLAQDACAVAGLRLRRIVLRACAAASLFSRSKAARPGELRLLVDLLGDETDLTVMIDRRVIFLRTTRMGGDLPPAQSLVAEIRRTMGAVQNQVGGRKVEVVVLCGQGRAHAELARQIEELLDTRTELFDPFDGLRLGNQLQRSLPEHAGRYASLLGVLLAELEQTGHAIDFLHPRRRPPPPNQRRRLVLAGAAATVLAVAWLVYVQVERHRLAGEVQQLQTELAQLNEAVKKGVKIRALAEEVSKWTEGDVVWLDQLHDLTEAFPRAEDAMLNELALSANVGQRTRGGEKKVPEMGLKCLVRKADTVATMKARLGRGPWKIVQGNDSEDTSLRPYGWRFDASLGIRQEDK